MAYIDDVYSVVQIQPTGIEAFVRLSQNENGRRLYFAITGGEIPTGSTATLSGTKPDGVVYSKTGTITGNVVTILEDVQLTAAAGPWPAKLRILNGGNVVATGRIRFVIDKDPVAAGAVPSDSQLEGLVAEAAAYAEAAKDGAYYGSPLTASTVAGMTDENRVYVYTGSESGYTAGNWYFWNGSAWTSGGVYNSQGIQTDKTLSVTGMAADAKAVGDALKEVKVETDKTLTQADVPADAKAVGDEIESFRSYSTNKFSNLEMTDDSIREDVTSLKAYLEQLEPGLSDEAKEALLNCFRHVAWIDEDGQDYYDVLESSLYPSDYPKIVAVYNSGQNTIYTDDTLDSLKQYLTVTYFETEESTGTIVPSANYTLSGALVVGTSTITIVYNNLTTSFKINNVVDFYNIATWSTSDLLSANLGNMVTELFPEIVSNTTSTNRAIVTCSHGKKEILQYNNNNPIPFSPSRYPIPIPNGATSATVTSRDGRPVMSIFRYENDGYTFLEKVDNSNWGNATFEINQTGQNLFAMFLNVVGENTPPSEVIIEYGFD